ncbi:hypothetical protein BC833DRAFT_591808 [Globomyces pollinis-pini]|nr:hypothetical protein BC833DRAFT_591808 [Globomyces pollinis-pini]
MKSDDQKLRLTEILTSQFDLEIHLKRQEIASIKQEIRRYLQHNQIDILIGNLE